MAEDLLLVDIKRPQTYFEKSKCPNVFQGSLAITRRQHNYWNVSEEPITVRLHQRLPPVVQFELESFDGRSASSLKLLGRERSIIPNGLPVNRDQVCNPVTVSRDFASQRNFVSPSAMAAGVELRQIGLSKTV